MSTNKLKMGNIGAGGIAQIHLGALEKVPEVETQAVREWYPDFYADTGNLLLTCFYVYGEGFPTVPPGEARTVTFASFAEPHEYVHEMRMTVLGTEYRHCFSPEGALTPCP